MAKKAETAAAAASTTTFELDKSFVELYDRIVCSAGLIFIDTPEETRVIKSIYKKFANDQTSIQFWSASQGMIEVPKPKDINPDFWPHDFPSSRARPTQAGQTTRANVVNALTVIEEDCRAKLEAAKKFSTEPTRTIYILRDVYPYFQQPGILRALRDIIYLVSMSSSSIIITGYCQSVPSDLEKDSLIIKLAYPKLDEISNRMLPMISRKICKINKGAKEEEKLDETFSVIDTSHACAGLTEEQILNALTFSLTKYRKIDLTVINEEKKAIINKSDILDYWVCTDTLKDIGGFDELKDWFDVEKITMNSPFATKFGAKKPKGIMLLGMQGSGKAQPLYSKVLMSNGNWKKMEDVIEGDYVRTPSGNIAKIIQIFDHKQKKNNRIFFKDGRTTECCDEHLWKVYNKDFQNKWKVVDTIELKKYINEQQSDTRRFYIPLIEEDNSAPTQLPIDPYILGVLIGDGCLTQPSVEFASEDIELAKKVEEKLTDDHKLVKIESDTRCTEYRISLKNPDGHTKNSYKSHLENLELWGKYSYEKHIPYQYLRASKEQKIELLQGLLDTDGYAGNSVSYSTTSYKLAEDIIYLIRSIGGIAYWSRKVSYCNNKECLSFTINIRYKDPKSLFSLTRKKNKLSDNYQYSNLKLEINEIEEAPETDMRCIMLDDDEHLYITDDFIVTHNTAVAKAVAQSWGVGLIKLEMGKIFAGLVGESEKRMRQALAQVDAVGGVVVIDEIDKGLSGAGSSDKTDGGTTARVIGTLLTWLSEPHDGVFLIATANDITNLNKNHPELLRKGRFDEIWFSDAPTEEERKEIFKIHLEKLKRDSSKFDLDELASLSYIDDSEGKSFPYTGAEIEYAVGDAIKQAFAAGGGADLEINGPKDITTDMIAKKLKIVKPISYISREVITPMRRWSKLHARNVSRSCKKKQDTIGSDKKAIDIRGSMADIDI